MEIHIGIIIIALIIIIIETIIAYMVEETKIPALVLTSITIVTGMYALQERTGNTILVDKIAAGTFITIQIILAITLIVILIYKLKEDIITRIQLSIELNEITKKEEIEEMKEEIKELKKEINKIKRKEYRLK